MGKCDGYTRMLQMNPSFMYFLLYIRKFRPI